MRATHLTTTIFEEWKKGGSLVVVLTQPPKETLSSDMLTPNTQPTACLLYACFHKQTTLNYWIFSMLSCLEQKRETNHS